VADRRSGVGASLSRVPSLPWLLLVLICFLVIVVLFGNPSGSANAFGDVLGEIAEHPTAFIGGLAALGTTAAFGLSLLLWVERHRDRKVLQSRRVSQWIGVKRFVGDAAEGPCLYVRNNSDQPIWEVSVEPKPDEADGDEAAGTWVMIPPGETRESFWRFWPDESSGVRPTISFIDDNGTAWHRDEFRLTHLGRVRGAIKTTGVDRLKPPRPIHRPRRPAGT
jgi:hypothetical protein